VQCAPGLLLYIKERIDERRAARQQCLPTGSQNLALAAQVTESLAGRAAMLQLLPLSRREASGQGDRPLPWDTPAPAPEPESLIERWRPGRASCST
jgi:predicted AAA+ superfamily ATPase